MTQSSVRMQRESVGGPIRIVVADDHPVVRDGVTYVLDRQPDFSVVGTASTGSEALQVVSSLAPDVAVLDVRMPGIHAVDLVQQLRALSTPPAVLMLTAYDDVAHIVRLLQTGAHGYVVKSEPPAKLVSAVRAVAAGRRWLSATVETKLVEYTLHCPDSSSTLSARELAVLELVVAGNTNEQIAHALEISAKTVEKHIAHLCSKLGVKTRLEAALYAVQNGLVLS